MKALRAQIPTLTVPAGDEAIGMQAEGAGTPTRLPPDCAAPAVRRQEPM
jgi:hypothetical protein